MTKNIPVFDIGDTLVPSREYASRIIEDELRQRNNHPLHKFDPAKFMMYNPKEVPKYLDLHDIDGNSEKLARDCRERYLEAFEHLMIEHEIFNLFAKCNEELGTVGIISDSIEMKQLIQKLLDKHKVEVDTITISDEVGTEKPDKEIFEAFLEERESSAENFVYIGRDAERDKGAEKAGMKFIWTKQFKTLNTNYQGPQIDKLDFENLKKEIQKLENRKK